MAETRYIWIAAGAGFRCRPERMEYVRETATQVVLRRGSREVRFRRSDGREIGGSKWHCDRLPLDWETQHTREDLRAAIAAVPASAARIKAAEAELAAATQAHRDALDALVHAVTHPPGVRS